MQEASGLRAAIEKCAQPSERQRLRARYEQLDKLLRSKKEVRATVANGNVQDHQKCPFCAETVKKDAIKCRFCGEFLDGRTKPAVAIPGPSEESPARTTVNLQPYVQSIDLSVPLGILGSVTLFLGAFAPILHAPLIGNVNYFKNGEGDGVIIVVLSVIGLILTLTRLTRWLYIPAMFAGATTAFTFYKLRIAISESRKYFDSLNDLGPFGDAMKTIGSEMLQMEWGWAVLVVGAVLLFSASAVYKKPSTA